MPLRGRPAKNVHHETRTTLDRYLPLLLGTLAALLAGRALKRLFWTAFGMYWALRASGIHPFA